MSIEFVYFDLGCVLLFFDHEIACRQMADVAGLETAVVRRVVFESGLEDQYERGEISTEQFYQEFCRRTQTSAPREALLEAASNIFTVNEPSVELAHRLHQSGRPLGGLSNTCEAHWDFVTSRWPFLTGWFRHWILSYEVGSMKPDAAIYAAAAARAGVEPEGVFFVDDRPDNVEGARRAGFDAVQYLSGQQLLRDLQERGLL